jgi:hypothetical protein
MNLIMGNGVLGPDPQEKARGDAIDKMIVI